jgi:hypothetical protein
VVGGALFKVGEKSIFNAGATRRSGKETAAMVGRSLGERSKSMQAMRRVAARA